jgi:chemotaxis response regulator CheB
MRTFTSLLIISLLSTSILFSEWRPVLISFFFKNKLILIFGGMGGLLEIQKLLPALPCDDDTAILLCQEMGPELPDFFADYMNDFTKITVLPLSHGAPLLSRQCWVAGWDAPIRVISDNDGAAVSAAEDEQTDFDVSTMVASAVHAFGSGLKIIMLSGAGFGAGGALADAVVRGAEIIVQEPASCLLPDEMKRLKERHPDFIYAEPEKIAGIVKGTDCDIAYEADL